MAVRLSDGGAGSFKNKGVKPAFSGGGGTFAPAPKPAAAKPVVNNIQPTRPPVRMAAPAPAPVYRAPAPAYNPPVYRAPAPVYNPPAINWGNVGAGGGGGGGGGGMAQSFAAPAPPPPPDTRRRINKATIGDKEIGEIDSTFADQDSAFAEALKKYVADFETDKGRQERDWRTAEEGISRNKKVGLTGMSEDFAARGLMNSGLFADANLEGGKQYELQKTTGRAAKDDNVARLTSNKAKFETETQNSRAAAKREALARLAARQDLVVE